MKTAIIISENNIDNFYGQEFDLIIEVPIVPVTTELPKIFEEARMSLRRLWNEDLSGDRRIVMTIAADGAYAITAMDLQKIMGVDEAIIIELPYNKPREPTSEELAAMREYERLTKSGR